MDSDDDLKTAISQPQKPPRFRNLGLALRALTLCVTISGIVVAAIPSSRNAEAIGILGPAVSLLPLFVKTSANQPFRPSAHHLASLYIVSLLLDRSLALLASDGTEIGGLEAALLMTILNHRSLCSLAHWSFPVCRPLNKSSHYKRPLRINQGAIHCKHFVTRAGRSSLPVSMDMKKQHIVIAGGGLGGLTAACRLARDGHKVDLFEKSQSLSTASGAIFVRSNGVRCFYRWEMREAFEAVTAPIREHETRNGDTNELLHTLNPGIYSEFPEWSTDRQALQTVLYEEACKAGAKVHFGKDIVSVEEDDQVAYATCKDGTRITADLILAADGISSRLRSQVLSHVDPSRLTVIRAPSTHYPTEIPAEMLDNDDRTKSLREQPESENGIMWAGHGGYAIGKYNHHRGLFNIMFSIQHGAADGEASEKKLFDATDNSKVVKSFFSSFNPTVVALASMVQSCSRWRLARLEPLDSWSSPKRRLVLLGDSAHAMLPNLAEGFSSIVEDIDALSILFSESSSDVPKIIEAWEKIRIPRVTRLQNGSTWNYKLYNSGKPPGSELTDEQRALSMGAGDGNAPFNTLPFDKWMFDYDTAKEVRLAMKA
ncbi:salicylate hydroxylase [Fusarium denticulatum]|uniref:Salicylate hydroxylase n=1 Tax=Fusarium denticulatum TaxID=48507 RepID=A0A8H5WX88_9HYPO|nr:salicylate hydroxylase [Fusarium denticulatum]